LHGKKNDEHCRACFDAGIFGKGNRTALPLYAIQRMLQEVRGTRFMRIVPPIRLQMFQQIKMKIDCKHRRRDLPVA
jgi:hypothetical protein